MPAGQLILKRACGSRPSGQWQDEDYDVLADGKIVGRIYEDASASTPPDMRWFWSITEIVPAVPNMTSGHAATLDGAKDKLGDYWTKGIEAPRCALSWVERFTFSAQRPAW